jgi:hypothetical protein
MFNTFEQFKLSENSEKIILAILKANFRMINFTLHSGNIYKKINTDIPVISNISYDGVSITEVFNLTDVVINTFYNDRTNNILYLNTNNSNPNTKYITVTRDIHLSNAPLNLPHDLSTGFDVSFDPIIKATSDFTSEIDLVNQNTMVIEGSGTLTLFNPHDSFWFINYENLNFDNQQCDIYVWNRQLDITEAKKVYSGVVISKSYNDTQISFNLKDSVFKLRDSLNQPTVESLNTRTDSDLALAKVRTVYGEVHGFRPINTDVVVDGDYPLTGTVSLTASSTTLTGTSTLFLSEVYVNDTITLNAVKYTVKAVTSNTAITLDKAANISYGPVTANINSKLNKSFTNRTWKVCNHPICKITKTILDGSSSNTLKLNNVLDLKVGDYLYASTPVNQLTQISSIVNNNTITLINSLSTTPSAGVEIYKPLQNLRMGNKYLYYKQHYSVDYANAVITIFDDIESQVSDLKFPPAAQENVDFTNGSRLVNINGVVESTFSSYLKPGYFITKRNSGTLYRILNVVSDTQIELTTPYAETTSLNTPFSYNDFIFDPSNDILTCSVMGKTHDNTSSGSILDTPKQIVKDLLIDAGLSTSLNLSSFASEDYEYKIAMSIPDKFDDDGDINYRDVINNINSSSFGILFADENLELSYSYLSPSLSNYKGLLTESDMLTFKVDNTNKNMNRYYTTKYDRKEYDYTVSKETFDFKLTQNDDSIYLVGTGKSKTNTVVLTESVDAERLNDRFSHLLNGNACVVEFKTKINTIDYSVNDVIQIDHPLLFSRFKNELDSNRYFLIQRISKNFSTVTISAVDLSNFMIKNAKINGLTTSYQNTSQADLLSSGFISDSTGIINDDNSFFINKIF